MSVFDLLVFRVFILGGAGGTETAGDPKVLSVQR